MNTHPRTDKSRNSAFEKWQEHRIDNPEIYLSEYMLKSLDTLCRDMETELNEATSLFRECLPELEFALNAMRVFRADIQRSGWEKDASHINEKEIENTKKLIEKLKKQNDTNKL